jgi:predicted RNase H-like nuclease (RuvC/YqgF family)
MNQRYVIVGIDPGTTVGLAAVDLEGRQVGLTHLRNAEQRQVIDFITGCGRPLVIASDVASAPDSVSKIAAGFNAVLYSPPVDLLVKEKERLVTGLSPGNDHERDALAAALDAFHSMEGKIRKARKLAREAEEEIVAASIIGQRISEKIAELSKMPEEKSEKPARPRAEALLEARVAEFGARIAKLEGEMAAMTRENERLKGEAVELRIRAKRARETPEHVVRDRHAAEMAAKQRELEKASAELRELSMLVERAAAGSVQLMPKAGKDFDVVKNYGAFCFAVPKTKRLLNAGEIEELLSEYRSVRA